MTTYPFREDEAAFGDPRLWDADPDVCCAAFQLGACVHTEGPEAELTYRELEEFDANATEASIYSDKVGPVGYDDEPF